MKLVRLPLYCSKGCKRTMAVEQRDCAGKESKQVGLATAAVAGVACSSTYGTGYSGTRVRDNIARG